MHSKPSRAETKIIYCIIILGNRHGNEWWWVYVWWVIKQWKPIPPSWKRLKSEAQPRWKQDRGSPGCIWHWPRVWSPSFRTEEVYRRTLRTTGAAQRWRDTSPGDSPNPHRLPGTMTYNLIQTFSLNHNQLIHQIHQKLYDFQGFFGVNASLLVIRVWFIWLVRKIRMGLNGCLV